MLLDYKSLPLRDYHKAKRLIWDPQDIDFSQDKQDWAGYDERHRDLVRKGLALFLGGETAVTNDLSPLLIALKREGGHLEEEMFITTQLFEEAKHVEFFDLFLREVIGEPPDLASIASESYTTLFSELSIALEALLSDHSSVAQARAVASYHMIIEGVLAETGYYGFYQALRAKGLMPGFTRGIELLQRDESRHIAFGLHLLRRLIERDEAVWPEVESQLDKLMPLARGVYFELLVPFAPEVPFDLDVTDIMGYSEKQYSARLNALTRVR
jgi:ribonucleoside-diphosphate reductase beta chain